ncbi:hypothetical protein MY04_4994 [Flammeovirga sp. MY04]|uniref:hypothetical protein n=1 Tax=Flammeovirga sp. MY04 TaxID=1191459 RepID=UPI0008062A5E|nr:hypothetical protein [Flammeovirga sp. MY04]ANQ52329.1 hypothetical protein MY04_4994 [Flammeovirga sp. MY04]
MKISISNTEVDFNLLYPFYFILDKNFKFESVGKSFLKLFPNIIDQPFHEHLKLVRPWTVDFTYDELKSQLTKVFVFQNAERKLILRGQIILLEKEKK